MTRPVAALTQSLVVLGAIFAFVIAGGSAIAADGRSGPLLRDQIERLAAANHFEVDGLEAIGTAEAQPVTGSLEDQLSKLLFAHDYVVLRNVAGRIDRLVIVGAHGASAVARRQSASGVTTERRGTEHYVEATLDGRDGASLRIRLMVDTGASTVVLPLSMMHLLGYDPAGLGEVKLQTANGIVAGRISLLHSVRVGDAEAGNVAATFLPDDQLGGKPLLGMSFLGRFRLTIDQTTDTLRLEPNPR